MKREFGRIFHDDEKQPVRYELNSYPNAEKPETFFLRTAEKNLGGALTTEMVQAIGVHLVERHQIFISEFYVQSGARIWHEFGITVDGAEEPVKNPVYRQYDNRFDEKFAQYELEAKYGIQLARSTRDYIQQGKADVCYMEALAKQTKWQQLKENFVPYINPDGDFNLEIEHEQRLTERLARVARFEQFKQGFEDFCQGHRREVWPAYLQHLRDKDQQQRQQTPQQTPQQTQQQRQRR